jgi:hypothetical protein
VANDRNVVLDVWITIEKLVSSAEDKDSGKQKYDHGESESDAQRGNARGFNHSYQGGTVRYHTSNIWMFSAGCSDASVGFSDAAEEWMASPSSEGERAPGCAQTNGVPRRKRIPDQISTSKNRAHDTTVGAQSRAIRSRRERAGDKRNQCRDFIRSSETSQE